MFVDCGGEAAVRREIENGRSYEAKGVIAYATSDFIWGSSGNYFDIDNLLRVVKRKCFACMHIPKLIMIPAILVNF